MKKEEPKWGRKLSMDFGRTLNMLENLKLTLNTVKDDIEAKKNKLKKQTGK